MKIACEGCGAKYSIADEKVGARVIKIRCKKCGAAIVVRGDAASSAASHDYGTDAVWHVIVGGEQQGPVTPTRIGELITSGAIGWDAYVWREGQDEWKSAQDVEALVQAIMGSAPATQREAGTDLFAQSTASAFAGDDDVIASAPSPRAAPASSAMTGARNENSVLFSLSNLQSLATTSAKSAAAPAPSATPRATATTDGSGLIDIRALAGSIAATTNARSAPASVPTVDELLSIGAPSIALGSALAPPVVITETPASARGGSMIAAAALLAVAMLGGAGTFEYVSLHPREAIAAPPPIVAAPIPPPTAVLGLPVPPATTITAQPTPPATIVAVTDTPVAVRHPRPLAPRPTTVGVTPPPPPTTTAHTGQSLEELLTQAVGDHRHEATVTPDPALPTTPAASDVRTAMTAVTPAVTACGAGEHGVATVQIVIAGATGRVSSATVGGQFAGTPVGSCVALAVRRATFPHFRQSSFSVAYPFRL